MGFSGHSGIDADPKSNLVAHLIQVPSLGINVVTALEIATVPASTSASWRGGNDDMQLTARWMG